jgi:anti-anti-sigma factor
MSVRPPRTSSRRHPRHRSRGELDLGTSRALGAALAAAAEYGAARVVLDLRRLTFVDSSGISLIMKFKRHFAAEGVGLGVVKGGEIVQRAFAVSHVEPLLPWTGPPADATIDE